MKSTYLVFQFNKSHFMNNGLIFNQHIANLFFDGMVSGKVSYATFLEYYEGVATIEANNLDEVFEIGNIGSPEQINRIGKMRSISVGDIIGIRGEYYVVMPCGFELLTHPVKEVAA